MQAGEPCFSGLQVETPEQFFWQLFNLTGPPGIWKRKLS